MLRDVRFGFRVLMKQPGFTLIAVLTLALGIGATAAVFSLIQGVLLTAPPYRDPNRLPAPGTSKLVIVPSVRGRGYHGCGEQDESSVRLVAQVPYHREPPARIIQLRPPETLQSQQGQREILPYVESRNVVQLTISEVEFSRMLRQTAGRIGYTRLPAAFSPALEQGQSCTAVATTPAATRLPV
jgi:hypothetical protein